MKQQYGNANQAKGEKMRKKILTLFIVSLAFASMIMFELPNVESSDNFIPVTIDEITSVLDERYLRRDIEETINHKLTINNTLYLGNISVLSSSNTSLGTPSHPFQLVAGKSIYLGHIPYITKYLSSGIVARDRNTIMFSETDNLRFDFNGGTKCGPDYGENETTIWKCEPS